MISFERNWVMNIKIDFWICVWSSWTWVFFVQLYRSDFGSIYSGRSTTIDECPEEICHSRDKDWFRYTTWFPWVVDNEHHLCAALWQPSLSSGSHQPHKFDCKHSRDPIHRPCSPLAVLKHILCLSQSCPASFTF